jgi:hypothetical protein
LSEQLRTGGVDELLRSKIFIIGDTKEKVWEKFIVLIYFIIGIMGVLFTGFLKNRSTLSVWECKPQRKCVTLVSTAGQWFKLAVCNIIFP